MDGIIIQVIIKHHQNACAGQVLYSQSSHDIEEWTKCIDQGIESINELRILINERVCSSTQFIDQYTSLLINELSALINEQY
jgi:hypothetical protein